MVRLLLVVVLVLAVAVLVGFVVGYNKLRAADVRVAEALSGIDVELTRRAALIPALVQAVATFATHETAVLGRASTAQAALTSATGGASIEQRSAAERNLDAAVSGVLAVGSTYPQLNSSNNFLNLQENLADTENKLAFARQYYNDAVATLNRLVGTIPWVYLAPLAGVSEREYYRSPH
ncbi:LemA family protein [Mycolicibacterium neworleansense]|uniref:LemA family protein n=1 Tax=Mycolicibacterium neworleansense TaxID=146018 RepID=A0A0H5RLH3_9MYCO|nr:LemA family protein [Mycolicibacterium neworleansense]MCV7360464.1 LemA family protein [Mycolicibacterium neworleansense]CRZ14636.1 LemA family protein [Mycolicibacterium neworleansense]